MPRTRTSPAERRRAGAEAGRRGEAWAIPTLREPRYSQSLERGLAILAAFSQQRPVLGIADIADALGMSRSTTHRYVITLVALGYLEQGASRKYRLGLRVTDLGMAALSATGLREHARPALEELSRGSSYTATLAVLDGEDMVVLERVRSPRRRPWNAEPDLRPGSRLPARATALGMLLLAHLPDRERREAAARVAGTRLRPKAPTSKRVLKEQLEEISARGLAVSDQETGDGQLELAAPVRNQDGDVVAAVGISAPAAQITAQQLLRALGPQVETAAGRVSATLGFRRADERAQAR
jgi:IclR family transcriptional regulator, pca regulon regulatory protein